MLDRTREPAAAVDEYTGLWDWRRRIAELYASVRDHEDPAAAALSWRHHRDQLFGEHEQSPLDPDVRTRFEGLSYFRYDSAFRFAVELQHVPEISIETQTAGDDGAVVLTPFARTRGLDAALSGELTLYWDRRLWRRRFPAVFAMRPRATRLLAAAVICWTRSRARIWVVIERAA